MVTVTIKIDVKLHKQVKDYCKKNGLFVNKYIERAIKHYIEKLQMEEMEGK